MCWTRLYIVEAIRRWVWRQNQAHVARYVAEYDENGCVWLTNLTTKSRMPLAHGALLDVVALTPPRVTEKGGNA